MSVNEIEFDYSKLRGLIREKFQTEKNFANKLSISSASLSSKLNNKSYFSQPDMVEMLKLLDIPDEDTKVYFFTVKVRISEQDKQLS